MSYFESSDAAALRIAAPFLHEVVARPTSAPSLAGKTVALADKQKQRSRDVLRRKQSHGLLALLKPE